MTQGLELTLEFSGPLPVPLHLLLHLLEGCGTSRLSGGDARGGGTQLRGWARAGAQGLLRRAVVLPAALAPAHERQAVDGAQHAAQETGAQGAALARKFLLVLELRDAALGILPDELQCAHL